MNDFDFKIFVEGLTKTAIQKIYALSHDDAKKECARYRDIIIEMMEFWGLEEKQLQRYDATIKRCLSY